MTIMLNGSDLTVTQVVEVAGLGEAVALAPAAIVELVTLGAQPVSVLFGGASRRLPAYASFGEARSPQARAQAAVAAKAAGFRAMKIRISRTDWVSSLEAVRATGRPSARTSPSWPTSTSGGGWPAISPALDETQVRRIAAELAELGVFWLEEPLPGGDLDGMRALRGDPGGGR